MKKRITILIIFFSFLVIGVCTFKYFQYVNDTSPIPIKIRHNAFVMSGDDVISITSVSISGNSYKYNKQTESKCFEGKIYSNTMGVDDLEMEIVPLVKSPKSSSKNTSFVGHINFFDPNVDFIDRFQNNLYKTHLMYCDSIYFNEIVIFISHNNVTYDEILIAPADTKDEALDILKKFGLR